MVAQQCISESTTKELHDLDIFYLVRVKMKSVEVVADMLETNYFEIQQAVDRVTKRLLAAAPIDEDPVAARRRKYLSEQVAVERLTWLFNLAIQAHRRSMNDVTVTRRVGNDKPVTTTRTSAGDQRWVQAAGKLAQMLIKLSAQSLHDPLMEEIVRDNTAELAANPPKEDCSTKSAESPLAHSVEAQEFAATALEMRSCMESHLASQEAAKDARRTVQPAVHATVQPHKQPNSTAARRERARAEFLSG
ncbi:hypothetical protein [Anatilimnocola floriformis]|uniref:hypothetical protein n=1 Tax=Anatilimnocola floriformis TaxID=2948575 RepID=UPI0020C4873D|nr:hypothetical protein [Anatilimnocola floriformis]